MSVSKPDVTLNITNANQDVGNDAHRILFVGAMTASGTATSGNLYQDVDQSNIDTYFGARSMLAGMLRAAKNINVVNEMDAIPLDDAGGGTPAAGHVIFAGGPATEDGTIDVYIGSKENHHYEVVVEDTDSVTDIGDALVALITADTDAPFTAVNAAGDVTITAANDGTEGNFIGIKVEGEVAAVTYTITAFASGATNPTLTNVFDVIGDKRYQTIVWPSSWDTTELTDLLGDRWNATNDILDGIAIISVTDTQSNLKTTYNLLNYQYLWVHGNQEISETYHEGSALFELDYVIASQFAAIRALRLTSGISISKYVTAGNNGALDTFGGSAIASLPYFNTPFENLPLIEVGHEFTKTEITELNTAGVFVLQNNRARNSIIADQLVTTYKTDAASNPDVTFKYGNFVDTASNIREYMFNNLKSQYSQTRLTTGDLVPKRNMANQSSIESYLDKLYVDLSKSNYVLTQAGETALQYFKQNRTVTLDLANRSVSITMKVPMVTQLGVITGTIQIGFSTN